ncbi:MAG: hypothetical protein U0232_20790 [Thermomicrobiales bacterium]
MIYDQCQDVLRAADAVFFADAGIYRRDRPGGAFVVDYDTNVPLPPGDQITAIKNNARDQSIAWKAAQPTIARRRRSWTSSGSSAAVWPGGELALA